METRPSTMLSDLVYDHKGLRVIDTIVKNKGSGAIEIEPFSMLGADSDSGEWSVYAEASRQNVGIAVNQEAITLGPGAEVKIPVLRSGAVKFDMIANPPDFLFAGYVIGAVLFL